MTQHVLTDDNRQPAKVALDMHRRMAADGDLAEEKGLRFVAAFAPGEA